MTFKHTKFEDSPTMRSLVKVATQKGLIKEEILVKTASVVKQADYTPSGNLIVNILKLCSGLRDLGLEDNAAELESKFLNYKQAQSIYETSKETGDDVVDMAHPDGSHTVSNIEGDAVVETILDQHLKMVKVVNKQPTGKLASNTAILNAVKKVVAQDVTIPILVKKIQSHAQTILKTYNDLGWFTRGQESKAPQILVNQVNQLAESIDDDILNAILKTTSNVAKQLKPGFLNNFGGGLSEEQWDAMEFDLNTINNSIDKIKTLKLQPSGPTVNPVVKAFNDSIKSYLNTLAMWGSKIKTDPENSPKDIAEGMNWIVKKQSSIELLKNEFNNIEDKANAVKSFTGNLNKIIAEFPEFKNQWIGE